MIGSNKPMIFAAIWIVATATIMCVVAQQPPSADSGPESWKAPERAAKKKNPIPPTPAAIAAGKTLYEQECLCCHGTQGKGDDAGLTMDTTPADLSRPAMRDQTDGALFWKITVGRKPMPTEEARLTDEQRWQLVHYIRTFVPESFTAVDGKSGQVPTNATARIEQGEEQLR